MSSSQVAFVNRALAQVGADIQDGARAEIQAIGELVAGDAEILALARIRNIGDEWWDMRVGQNRELVYVVPWERGTKTPSRKRREFAPLMLRKAMRPAQNANQAEANQRFERLIAKIAAEFNHGG